MKNGLKFSHKLSVNKELSFLDNLINPTEDKFFYLCAVIIEQ